MAYTYDDFLKAANKANMLKQFDTQDLAVTKANPEYGLSMLRLMQDRKAAASPEARLLAKEAMNQLRSNYNVNVLNIDGITDPEIDAKDDSPSSNTGDGNSVQDSGFQYDREDEYQKLLEQITNPPDFQYDPQKDPSWSAYRKMYLREGDRATQNSLAKASVATGGVPSSYAVLAAQQAGANYAEKLADALPALEQQAYERYLQNHSIHQNAFDAINTDRKNAYEEWSDDYKTLLDKISYVNGIGISDEDLVYLQQTYPSGVITDQSTWDNLVALYGEDTLKTAGYSFQTAGNTSTDPYARLGMTGFANEVAAAAAVPQLPGVKIGTLDDAIAVDSGSLEALGYGDLSAEEVAALVNNGTIVQYVENGVLKFRLP